MIPFRRIKNEDKALMAQIRDIQRQATAIIEVSESNMLNLERDIKQLKLYCTELEGKVSLFQEEIDTLKAKVTEIEGSL